MDGNGDLAKRLALFPDEDMSEWDRPVVNGADAPTGSLVDPTDSSDNGNEDDRPVNGADSSDGSQFDPKELLEDDNENAPPPTVKKRRSLRSRLRRVKELLI